MNNLTLVVPHGSHDLLAKNMTDRGMNVVRQSHLTRQHERVDRPTLLDGEQPVAVGIANIGHHLRQRSI